MPVQCVLPFAEENDAIYDSKSKKVSGKELMECDTEDLSCLRMNGNPKNEILVITSDECACAREWRWKENCC